MWFRVVVAVAFAVGMAAFADAGSTANGSVPSNLRSLITGIVQECDRAERTRYCERASTSAGARSAVARGERLCALLRPAGIKKSGSVVPIINGSGGFYGLACSWQSAASIEIASLVIDLPISGTADQRPTCAKKAFADLRCKPKGTGYIQFSPSWMADKADYLTDQRRGFVYLTRNLSPRAFRASDLILYHSLSLMLGIDS
jgi:hypothetical protein